MRYQKLNAGAGRREKKSVTGRTKAEIKSESEREKKRQEQGMRGMEKKSSYYAKKIRIPNPLPKKPPKTHIHSHSQNHSADPRS